MLALTGPIVQPFKRFATKAHAAHAGPSVQPKPYPIVFASARKVA